MSQIEHQDARDYLRSLVGADLILTDPPHLDTYLDKTFGHDAQLHLEFTREWLPLALDALDDHGTLVHSCGSEPAELRNYLEVKVPGQLLVWPHENGHHFYLVRHKVPTFLQLTACTIIGPKPAMYKSLVHAFTQSADALVVDPFAGRGEIPAAARDLDRRWAGCELEAERVAACREQGL